MAGIIEKGFRGAFAAGAQLSMDQHRANIVAQRDATLRQYRSEDRAAEQSYQTSEREAGEVFNKEQAELDRENVLKKLAASRKSEGATQADVQFMNHLVSVGVATDDNDAFAKLKELRMKDDPNDRVMKLAQMLQSNDPEYKRESVENYFSRAQQLDRKFFEKEPDPVIDGNKGGSTGAANFFDQFDSPAL